MFSILPLAFLATFAFAALAPQDLNVEAQAERFRGPVVRVDDGIVVGKQEGDVESWFGIPYAEPPVGLNRLKAPTRLNEGFGIFNATAPPAACPQFGEVIDTTGLPEELAVIIRNIVVVPQRMSEDCLTLNVQRPVGATRRASLPVLVWIYGGGFETGDISRYNGQDIVRKSIELRQDVVFVAINYRLNGFGFLRGQEVSEAGASNLGLRDQRLALEWVADNIHHFGGDRSRVTIWGESAGAGSVFAQTIINSGDNYYKGKRLFRGAIQNSGGPSSGSALRSPASQASYDAVVADAGCANTTDTLACLRSVPYEVYADAVRPKPGRSLVFGPGFDPADDFYPSSSIDAISAGNFTRVPLMQGTQEDEGTLSTFRVKTVNSTDGVIDFLARGRGAGVDRATIAEFLNFYPEDPSAGSPFGTGADYELYPQYKRLAAASGDIGQQFGRRSYTSLMAARLPAVYAYHATYNRGTPYLGTFHGSDVGTIFNFRNSSALPARSSQVYYLSFVNHLDPNAIVGAQQASVIWPRYTPESRQIMNLGAEMNVVEPDTYREEAYRFWEERISAFKGIVPGAGKD